MADILQITLPDGTTYNLKDSTAVTNVSYSTSHKIQKTINGVTTDVVELAVYPGTGSKSICGGYNDNTASGNYAVAIGPKVTNLNATSASQIGAIAIGASTYSSGLYSISFGYNNTSSGTASLAMGTRSTASADYSVAIGKSLIASSTEQIVLGKFNVEDDQSEYCFIIGNGTDANNRSNVLTVDQHGNIDANNIITSTSISNTGLISFKNSGNTTVYTTQLPVYDGSVTGGNPGSNRYVVTITYDSQNDEYSADKTFAQIYAACEAGKVVQAYIDDWDTNISLNFYNDGAIAFGYLDAEAVMLFEFVINDDDTVSSWEIQLQVV